MGDVREPKFGCTSLLEVVVFQLWPGLPDQCGLVCVLGHGRDILQFWDLCLESQANVDAPLMTRKTTVWSSIRGQGQLLGTLKRRKPVPSARRMQGHFLSVTLDSRRGLFTGIRDSFKIGGRRCGKQGRGQLGFISMTEKWRVLTPREQLPRAYGYHSTRRNGTDTKCLFHFFYLFQVTFT